MSVSQTRVFRLPLAAPARVTDMLERDRALSNLFWKGDHIESTFGLHGSTLVIHKSSEHQYRQSEHEK